MVVMKSYFLPFIFLSLFSWKMSFRLKMWENKERRRKQEAYLLLRHNNPSVRCFINLIKIISLLKKAKSNIHILLSRVYISYIQCTWKWIRILQNYFNKCNELIRKTSMLLITPVKKLKTLIGVLNLEF